LARHRGSDAYPDPKLKNPKRPVVDLSPEKLLKKQCRSRSQGRRDAQRDTTGAPARLSVMPLSEAEFKRLMSLAGN
jgi:predicted RNA-binding protein with PUA-like domain